MGEQTAWIRRRPSLSSAWMIRTGTDLVERIRRVVTTWDGLATAC